MAHSDLQIEQFQPSAPLKPHVKTFMIIASDQAAHNRLLPDTSTVLAFRLEGAITDKSNGNDNKLPSAVITGLRKSPRFLSYGEETACLLVIFKEGGAA